MKKVITYGTCALFHYGHMRILERAKSFGDYLIVAVSTEEFNAVKGKRCIYPSEYRSIIVASIKYVDQVIPENNWEQKVDDVTKYKIDVLVMGDDWEGKFDCLSNLCHVVYLP